MTTMTETELKMEGMALLMRHLGEIQAETFISLMLREPFDYTAWFIVSHGKATQVHSYHLKIVLYCDAATG